MNPTFGPLDSIAPQLTDPERSFLARQLRSTQRYAVFTVVDLVAAAALTTWWVFDGLNHDTVEHTVASVSGGAKITFDSVYIEALTSGGAIARDTPSSPNSITLLCTACDFSPYVGSYVWYRGTLTNGNVVGALQSCGNVAFVRPGNPTP